MNGGGAWPELHPLRARRLALRACSCFQAGGQDHGHFLADVRADVPADGRVRGEPLPEQRRQTLANSGDAIQDR